MKLLLQASRIREIFRWHFGRNEIMVCFCFSIRVFCKYIIPFIQLQFIYSEKATKFWEISIVDLSYAVPVKTTVDILQNFEAFSEYMNLMLLLLDERN